MIYEKRCGMAKVTVKSTSESLMPMSLKSKTDVVENNRKEQSLNGHTREFDACSVKCQTKWKRHKRHKKNRVFTKFAVVTITLFFCLSTLDSKFNDGKLKDFAVSVLSEKLREYSLNQHREETEGAFFGLEELPEMNLSVKDNVTQPIDKQTFTEYVEKTQKDAVAVSSPEKTHVGVDGEVFYPITAMDLSVQSVTAINNETVYEPDVEIINNTLPKALKNYTISHDEPSVLIVHTHGCEAYTEYDDMYPKEENTRTTDTEKNVVRVGREISDILESYGISTIHCTRLCDEESFIDAYDVSHDVVKEYLEKYPSIRVVLDVHRDAIVKQSGESIKPSVNIAGQDYAQLMFVVGTGQSAHSHSDWEENLSLAMCIQNEAHTRYPGLFRAVNLRKVPFNQWLSCGYLLLEVGSSANKLDEALASAQAFGHILSAVLKENSIS